MDAFSSPSSSGRSSSPPSTDALMEQVKHQLAQAYAEEFLEVYHLCNFIFLFSSCFSASLSLLQSFDGIPYGCGFPLTHSHMLFIESFVLILVSMVTCSFKRIKKGKNLIWVSTVEYKDHIFMIVGYLFTCIPCGGSIFLLVDDGFNESI